MFQPNSRSSKIVCVSVSFNDKKFSMEKKVFENYSRNEKYFEKITTIFYENRESNPVCGIMCGNLYKSFKTVKDAIEFRNGNDNHIHFGIGWYESDNTQEEEEVEDKENQ